MSSMFFGASPDIFQKAATLRKKMTQAEIVLWNILRNYSEKGYKFRRQHPMGCYIADFYCHKLKLVIELDGNYHLETQQINADLERDKTMNSWGIRVVRYSNQTVLNNTVSILDDLQNFILEHSSNK